MPALHFCFEPPTMHVLYSTMFKGRALKSRELVNGNNATYTTFIEDAFKECIAWPNCYYVVTKVSSSGGGTLGQAWLMGSRDALT